MTSSVALDRHGAQHLATTVVGMEACGASHYWARELTALGHEVAAPSK